jgi:hypothetical protein
MSTFRFTVSNLESRQEGVIESESFSAAVDALGHHVTVKRGDVLEIGVSGFPPARYECIAQIGLGQHVWAASAPMAA